MGERGQPHLIVPLENGYVVVMTVLSNIDYHLSVQFCHSAHAHNIGFTPTIASYGLWDGVKTLVPSCAASGLAPSGIASSDVLPTRIGSSHTYRSYPDNRMTS